MLDLLQAGGAKIESQVTSRSGDRVDAVALIPGAERVLGPVLIEVKALQGRGLTEAVIQLMAFLGRGGGGVGLVVYDGPRQEKGIISGWPVVLVLHIDELRELVNNEALGSILILARNAAVHGRIQ